jgi:spectinomycin phosphotransferase
VLTRPDDIIDAQIVAELAVGWGFHAETCSYLPAGFGSHHWLAADAAGNLLFLIVHDLAAMLHSPADTADAAFGRLPTAFRCAVSLRRDADLEFVTASANSTIALDLSTLTHRAVLRAAGCLPGLS